jgi:Ras-associated and pleckstrin homology domains-containing protein 1
VKTRVDTTSILIDHDDSCQHASKILVRTYNDDGSTKSILVDESMLIRDVLFMLIHKNHGDVHIDYVLVEILPDLHMGKSIHVCCTRTNVVSFLERLLEDHQKLSETILMWPTVSTNRLSFTRRSEKYSLFRAIASDTELTQTPDIEGVIHFKEKSRKSWKKHFCVLRSSGLYYVPKGKGKVRRIMSIDVNYGTNMNMDDVLCLFGLLRKILFVSLNSKMSSSSSVSIGKRNSSRQVNSVSH